MKEFLKGKVEYKRFQTTNFQTWKKVKVGFMLAASLILFVAVAKASLPSSAMTTVQATAAQTGPTLVINDLTVKRVQVASNGLAFADFLNDTTVDGITMTDLLNHSTMDVDTGALSINGNTYLSGEITATGSDGSYQEIASWGNGQGLGSEDGIYIFTGAYPDVAYTITYRISNQTGQTATATQFLKVISSVIYTDNLTLKNIKIPINSSWHPTNNVVSLSEAWTDGTNSGGQTYKASDMGAANNWPRTDGVAFTSYCEYVRNYATLYNYVPACPEYIKVTGAVNTAVAGNYTVTYEVSTDSQSAPTDSANYGNPKTATVTVTAASTTPVYRLYNKNTGEHFYTVSLAEKNADVKAGWSYEGIGWNAPRTSQTPIYRLYNPNVSGGDHYYTKSKAEAGSLAKAGWKWDNAGKPVFYSGGSKNVYVAYNPNAQSGAHNFTVSSAEQNSLLKVGWKYGAVAWNAE